MSSPLEECSVGEGLTALQRCETSRQQCLSQNRFRVPKCCEYDGYCYGYCDDDYENDIGRCGGFEAVYELRGEAGGLDSGGRQVSRLGCA